MTYISKINNISYAGRSRAVDIKIEISAGVYEALRANRVLGAVEAVSPVGEVKIKTAIGNLVISNASFLKVFDNVAISIKQDTLVIEKTNTIDKSMQVNARQAVSDSKDDLSSVGLLTKIDQLKREFDLGKCHLYEMKQDDIAGTFLDVMQNLLLESDTNSTSVKEVFDISKNLSWSLIFLPLKIDEKSVLARLFIKHFENKKYKDLVLECEHKDFGNCIVLIKLETSSFSSVALSVVTEREMPSELQSQIKQAADDIAMNIGFSYTLDFLVDSKKASDSKMSELLAEYCIGRAAANTTA